jgi:hypothetical protein
MIRNLFVLGVCCALCSACGGSSDASPAASSAGSGNAGDSCPDVSGAWQVTDHCDSSLIGMTMNVTETACALTFSKPFDVFSGNVTTDGKITISGVQTCTGNASSSAISMSCTPGTCVVKLSR